MCLNFNKKTISAAELTTFLKQCVWMVTIVYQHKNEQQFHCECTILSQHYIFHKLKLLTAKQIL
jgi:hypothetical protein